MSAPTQMPTAGQWFALLSTRMSRNEALNQQELNALLMTVQRMKNDGTWQLDPDYAKLIEALHVYTQRSSAAVAAAAASRSSAQNANAAPPPPPPTVASFSPDQLQRLKHQILAFKYLSKNLPIPQEVQRAIQLSRKATAANATSVNSSAGVLPTKIAESAFYHATQPSTSPNIGVTTPSDSVNGFGNLRPVAQISTHRTLVPVAHPVGLDPIALAEERNRRIHCRILNRIAELESLPSNLPNEPPQLELLPDDKALQQKPLTKLRALVELKSLRLLERQKKLRAEIILGMKRATTLQTAVSRADYRRLKKPSVREIRMTEKMEKQQRLERERKEKQKQLEYVNGILQHGRDLLAHRKGLMQKQVKLGRAVLHWHSNVEKEEQKRLERVTKERIRALKADDEEAYLKLIDKQKDTRITHLLQQTDSYLSSLTSLIQTQKEHISRQEEEAIAAAPPGTMAPPEQSAYVEDDQSTLDYYNVCHRIREPVIEQPSMLQNGNLKEYQLKGLEWMVSLYNNKLNGILADEMGLGKTIQTISLISFLMEKKNQNGPFLILVPLSTITNWSIEFEKWAPNVVKVVYKGTPNQRRHIQMTEMRAGTFNVVLTTYEYIIKDKSVLSKFRWTYTIIDEGHRMKNAASKLSITLTQHYHSRYRLILTGTPLQNNLPELWALLNFILPKVFNSVKSFDEWFNAPFANTGEHVELNEEEQLLVIKRLHKVLRPFLLRRMKKDVAADLPDKTERVLKTPLSAIQQKLYNQIRRSGAMMIGNADGKKVGVRSIQNTVMQLRKVCNHPYVFNEVEDALNPNHITDENLMRTSGKFELLDRVLPKLKATGHRVLIFFQMTAVMDIMEDYLRWRDMKYLRLDGSTKAEDRSALLKLFNAPDSEYFLFILSTRAGGLGLNLQSADTVVIFDSDWNPQQDLQAQDRAHRIGQTKEVRIFRLVSANTVEETILARAQFKLDLDKKLIDGGKYDNKSTNEERDQFLRALFEADPESNEFNDVDDDDELNEIISRSDEELKLFKKIDAERVKEDAEWWKSTGRKGPFSRLITTDELPAHYLHEYVPEEKEDISDMGRGQRVREAVRYDDGLTEEQWTRAVDNEVDIDELVEKREKLKEKRRQKKAMENADEDDESVSGKRQRSVSAQPTEADSPKSKKAKTGGKSRKIDSDFEEDEESDHEPVAAGKKLPTMDSTTGGKKLPVPEAKLSKDKRDSFQKILESCYQAVEDCTMETEDGGTRQRCELFWELPSRELYPDYYEIIKNPISLDIIRERIEDHFYHSLSAFKNDFHLMFKNAQTYNVEGSLVYDDAEAMKEVFESTLKRLSAGHKF